MLFEEILRFEFLMAVFFDDLLLKFWAVCASFTIDGEGGIAAIAEDPLRIVPSCAVFFGLGAVAVDAVSHFQCRIKK